MTDSGPMGTSSRWIWAAFTVVTIAGGIALWVHLRDERRDFDRVTHEQLQAVSALTIDLLAQWRRERRADAEALAADPLLPPLAARVIAGTAGEAELGAMRGRLELCRRLGYSGVRLVDGGGHLLVGVGAAGPDAAAASTALARAIRAGAVTDTGLRRGDGGELTLELVAPLRAPAAGHGGAVVLTMPVAPTLARVGQTWPTTRRTAESLVVKREGDAVVVLSSVRHHRDSALRLRLDARDPDLPAAKAVRGIAGPLDGRDYRGIPVLAVGAAVPGSDWFLVTKVDRAEVEAPLRDEERLHVIAWLCFTLACGALLVALRRQLDSAAVRRQLAADRERTVLLRRTELLSRHAHDIILLIDGGARIVDANERACATYGYRREQLLGLPLSAIAVTPPERIERRLARAVTSGGLVFAAEHRRADGSVLPVEVSLSSFMVDGARFSLAVVRDATERRRAEEALRRSEERFRLLASRAPVGIAEIGPQGGLIFASERLAAIAGRPAEELFGEGYMDAIHPDDRARAAAAGRECAATGRDFAIEYRTARPDGTVAWVYSVIVPTHGPDGARTGYLATLTDITERKRAEAALAYDAQILAHVSDAVLAVDAELAISAWNPGAERLYGWTAAEVVGRPAGEVFGRIEDDGNARASLWPQADGAPVAGLFRPRRRDGGQLEVEVTSVPLRDAAGGCAGYVGVHRDVTERNRLQARLLRAEHLASLGTLAAGLAHEINNPLAYVYSNVEYALEELKRIPGSAETARRLEEVVTALGDAREGAGRVRDLVRDLRGFTRPTDEARRPVDVAQVVRLAVNMAHNEIRHRARLVLDLPPGICVDAGEARLSQVFLNLLINAAQAIPDGDVAANEIGVMLGRDAAGRVRVEIRDTGAGIPPDAIGRIFDPFFTTKPVGVGTGLGLAIAHSAVADLGGELEVESEPGRGAVFRVLLPPSAATPPVAGAQEVTTGERRRILVIDDEPAVARALERLLGRAHEVTTLTSPAKGLARLLRGERFDAIFCDVMMPEMSGLELWRRLDAAAPALAARVIFMSGGVFTPQARDELAGLPNRVVTKPFVRAAVLEAVQAVAPAATAASAAR